MITRIEWRRKYLMEHFKEECYFLYGTKILGTYFGILLYHSKGERTGVKFNWKKVVKSHFLLGFFHSHPPGCLYCSERDKETMGAWVRAEGRPLICGILCEGSHLTYLFHRKSSNGIEMVSKIKGKFFVGRIESSVLKELVG